MKNEKKRKESCERRAKNVRSSRERGSPGGAAEEEEEEEGRNYHLTYLPSNNELSYYYLLLPTKSTNPTLPPSARSIKSQIRSSDRSEEEHK